LDHRFTITVFADDKRISQNGWPPDVDALATPGLSIDDGNHSKNSFLVSARLPTANTCNVQPETRYEKGMLRTR
jgi:hypothetical protein